MNTPDKSEDEKIRKALINTLQEKIGLGVVSNGYSREDYISWLEKEQSAEDEEMLDAMIDIVSNSFYEPLCPREGMLTWLKNLKTRLKL